MKNNLLLISLVIGLSSCHKTLDYKEYFNYYNQFSAESFIEFEENGFNYKLQYRPKEFMAINDLKSDPKINAALITKVSSEYDNGYSFCLRISSTKNEDVLEKNTQSKTEYFDRIGRLNADFPYAIVGVNGVDTIRCQFHHYERTYKVQPFVQILFSLNPMKSAEIPEKVVFQDIIFNNGLIIEFKDFKTYYNQLPKLKI
jgi:hypothetical protein